MTTLNRLKYLAYAVGYAIIGAIVLNLLWVWRHDLDCMCVIEKIDVWSWWTVQICLGIAIVLALIKGTDFLNKALEE